MKVRWIHDLPSEPVWLYSEVVDGREVRKVEVFRDGHMDYADDKINTGATMLSETFMPVVEEIASDPQFVPVAILADEFEDIWRLARG